MEDTNTFEELVAVANEVEQPTDVATAEPRARLERDSNGRAHLRLVTPNSRDTGDDEAVAILKPEHRHVVVETATRLHDMLTRSGPVLIRDLLDDVFWGGMAGCLEHDDRLNVLAFAVENIQSRLKGTGKNLKGRETRYEGRFLLIT